MGIINNKCGCEHHHLHVENHEHKVGNPLDKVGNLYVGSNFAIYCNNQGEYITVSEDTGEQQEFTWEERISYLCKPWDEAKYHEDDMGRHHYICNVYDGIYIDIWRNTLQELMALLCNMLIPTDEMFEIILDRVDKHNKELNKQLEEDASSGESNG